jgi:uncharacterized protein (TIGR02611 family)
MSIDPPKHKLLAGLQARRDTHRQRSLIIRALVVVAGFTVLLGGAAMIVLPGPAVAVIPVGLGLLALEFAWAERALEHALDKAAEAKRKASQTTDVQKALVGLAVLAAAAAVLGALLLWHVPIPLITTT